MKTTLCAIFLLCTFFLLAAEQSPSPPAAPSISELSTLAKTLDERIDKVVAERDVYRTIAENAGWIVRVYKVKGVWHVHIQNGATILDDYLYDKDKPKGKR